MYRAGSNKDSIRRLKTRILSNSLSSSTDVNLPSTFCITFSPFYDYFIKRISCHIQRLFFSVQTPVFLLYLLLTPFICLCCDLSSMLSWFFGDMGLLKSLSNANCTVLRFNLLNCSEPLKAYWLRDAPTSLTFNNCTLCPHCINVFCIYLRTNSDLCHLQHKLIGFYNRNEKCLQRGTDWVFK